VTSNKIVLALVSVTLQQTKPCNLPACWWFGPRIKSYRCNVDIFFKTAERGCSTT